MASEVLSTHRHRLAVERSDNPQVQINLPGTLQQRISASINGSPVLALGDTGAVYNIMEVEFARQLGLRIDTSKTVEFEFLDGRATESEGIVRTPFQFRASLCRPRWSLT
jgi:predicted aspartyl protease